MRKFRLTMTNTASAILIMAAVSAIIINGCIPAVSLYSGKAYEQTVSLKVASLATMDLAIDDYSSHVAEVKALDLRLREAYEYAKGRPKNEISTKQW
jgi:hypothetical protein